jgi:hypothetical protein
MLHAARAALLMLFALQSGAPATFQNRRLRESSGVAASRTYPGVLWSHNDSGDGPYLYATDLSGRDRGWLLVPGASAVDWEDMAVGPCPTAPARRAPARDARPTSCVYIADTGDNRGRRQSVTVYAIPEPEPTQGPGDTLRTTRAPAVLRLRYPDGAHDVEAIFVSPRDSALYLVSKESFRVYRVARAAWGEPGKPSDITVAAWVQNLDIRPNIEAGRVATGAAIRPDGRVVAIRTYTEIYLFHPGVGGRLTPAREHPCNIAGLEIGGEAVTFLDDSTFVLTSEAAGRHPGTILAVKCPLSSERP